MHINDLPDDVLRLVFKRATHQHIHTLTEWSRSLALLAVCSRWRAVALPLVYQTMTVVHGDMDRVLDLIRTGQPGNNDNNGGEEEGEDAAALLTNAGLVSGGGHAGLVRHVHVMVHHAGDPSRGLGRVLDELAAVLPSWPRVQALTLALPSVATEDDNNSDDDDRTRAGLLAAAARVAAVFPGLVNVELEGVHSSEAVRAAYGCIAGRFAGRARRLACRQPLGGLDAARFERLEALAYGFDETRHPQPPRVDCARLRHLRMYGVPYDYAWRAFGCSGGDGRTLEFPELARLALSFESPRMDGGSPTVPLTPASGFRLVFPRLRVLELLPGCGDYPIFDYGVFPRGIRLLRLSCQADMLRVLRRAAVPRLDALDLSATGNSVCDLAADLDAIGALAARARTTASARLVVLGSMPVRVAGCAPCPCLTDLAVTAPTDATVVLGLVRLLPGLTAARLHSVVLDGAHAEAARLRGCNPWADVGPLPSRIRWLGLGFARPDAPGPAHAAFAVHLLARLPHARTLKAVQLPAAHTAALAAALAPRWPHLADAALLLAPTDPMDPVAHGPPPAPHWPASRHVKHL
ncbi:hypothetical protein H4R18_002695 [Coemansia javaensis]|uniref:F-box domain-containing protein n=1 Tax=Coemansia javaensis TaxID=2761396 RepID=A0A9W8LHD2_9FUNG|nr:hypothetical protein H4R18_002695 [Coemansia javaensis]